MTAGRVLSRSPVQLRLRCVEVAEVSEVTDWASSGLTLDWSLMSSLHNEPTELRGREVKLPARSKQRSLSKLGSFYKLPCPSRFYIFVFVLKMYITVCLTISMINSLSATIYDNERISAEKYKNGCMCMGV